MNLTPFVAALLFLILLPGCVGSRPVRTDWPIQAYPLVCGANSGFEMAPFEPGCAKSLHGNQYHFNACRESYGNYFNALDAHYDCVVYQAENDLKEYKEELRKWVACMRGELQRGAESSAAAVCASPKRFESSLPIIVIENLPNCVSILPPSRESLLDICEDSIVSSLEEIKGELERELAMYHGEVEGLKQEAVDLFNCYAEGNKYCQ